ncbi:MAG: CAAX amino terminal protease self- immunity [Chloroflexi bacterium ADurb.Bin222]|nr:MAG: CAAX amino terminal protease self- immunity [Chloroflexi bacterium ADurb.Bin222]
MAVVDWVKKRPLWVYFVLACAITWALMVPAMIIATQKGYALPSPVTFGGLIESGFANGQHVALSLMLALAHGPLIGAIVVAAAEGSLREWWQRVTRWRAGAQGYRDLALLLVALYVPVVLIGLATGIFPAAEARVVPLIYLAPFFLYEVLTSGMEEPGWRGYALPKLLTRFNAKKASLILGLVWGLWHWPVFIENYIIAANDPTTPLVADVIGTAVQCLGYIGLSILPMAFIHTWLYNRTQSAFLSLLLHATANVLSSYTLATQPMVGTIGGVMRWVVAIVLLRFFWTEAARPSQGIQR